MNQKKAYRPSVDQTGPQILHQVDIDVEDRGKITGHRLVRNVVFTVRRRTNLAAGDYVFQYAELYDDGTTLIYGDRYGMRKTIFATDIAKVKGGN